MVESQLIHWFYSDSQEEIVVQSLVVALGIYTLLCRSISVSQGSHTQPATMCVYILLHAVPVCSRASGCLPCYKKMLWRLFPVYFTGYNLEMEAHSESYT